MVDMGTHLRSAVQRICLCVRHSNSLDSLKFALRRFSGRSSSNLCALFCMDATGRHCRRPVSPASVCVRIARTRPASKASACKGARNAHRRGLCVRSALCGDSLASATAGRRAAQQVQSQLLPSPRNPFGALVLKGGKQSSDQKKRYEWMNGGSKLSDGCARALSAQVAGRGWPS